jgi:hypothetical protein
MYEKNPEGTGEIKNAGCSFSSMNKELHLREFSLRMR